MRTTKGTSARSAHIILEMEDAQQMGGNEMSVGLMAPLKDFHFVLGTTAPATSIGQPPGGLRTRTGTTRTTQVTVKSEEIKKFALKYTAQSSVGQQTHNTSSM